MKIGILVAMEEEIKKLVDEISSVSIEKIANQTFYNGIISNQPVTIVQAGIGKVNAALATTLLIQTYNVDLVINTGSAGAIMPNLKIGDLVIGKDLAYNDVDNQVFGYEFGQIPQTSARFKADEKLNSKIEKVAEKHKWNTHQGLIVTGDSFISDHDKINEIKSFFPDVTVTEMEGAAVGQVCVQFEVPFAVVRAVSDTADEEASIDFDEFVLEAGRKSATLILKLIEEISNEE